MPLISIFMAWEFASENLAKSREAAAGEPTENRALAAP